MSAKPAFRSGFVALAGRPNAGKSTFVNTAVGTKVAIVSGKPQTTRRAIRGVWNGPECQLVLTDLPGVQKPLDALTERMQRRVERELADANAVLFVLDGTQRIGAGDRFIAQLIAASGLPVAIALNKIDRLNRAEILQALASVAELDLDGPIFPISARKGEGVIPLLEYLGGRLPEGPRYFPDDQLSDQTERQLFAELIREQVLARTRQEVPHAVEVEIDEIVQARKGLTTVRALVWVETESQKAIVIGTGGQQIRRIGTGARGEIERKLGHQIYLDLSVRVRKQWRKDSSLLDRLGID